ncbi:hypothetical protein ACFL6I_09380 [candidate division KSB1 bacterium]
MGIPAGEFRSLDITLAEPSNRTSAGTVINATNPLDFGTVNNTSGYIQAGPRVIWWRCTDLAGNTVISNMKFWMSSDSDLVGTNEYYCDITGIWTQNKTITQVSTGSPGLLPKSLPVSNIAKIGGGTITGTGHSDTSQYIYTAISVGPDEAIGAKGGVDGGFQLSLKFDYA